MSSVSTKESVGAAVSGNSYVNYTTNQSTTAVKTSSGTLKAIVVNAKGTVASVINIYDSNGAASGPIAEIDSLNLSGTFEYDLDFSTGLTVSSTGTVAADFTVIYK